MAFFKIDNVNIAGISACVPPKRVDNMESTLLEDKKELEKYIETTGVRYRYIAEDGICSSDLCKAAAERLIEDMGIDKSEIGCLIMVTQTPDYIFPATACVLQDRLGLPTDCMSFDITMSCPGWIYGLSVMSSILSAGKVKKGLLLVFTDNICYIQNSGSDLYPATLRARDALARKTTAKETYMETLNKETILQLCKILYNKKAMDIRAIEVTDKTIIADWFIVCSGRGVPQVKALSDELEEKAAEMGLFPRRKEGYQEGRWIVLDFGDLLVHLFHPEERTYYNLERLLDDGQNVITYTEEGDAK